VLGLLVGADQDCFIHVLLGGFELEQSLGKNFLQHFRLKKPLPNKIAFFKKYSKIQRFQFS
jgi:hypothetical protein